MIPEAFVCNATPPRPLTEQGGKDSYNSLSNELSEKPPVFYKLFRQIFFQNDV